MSTLFVVATPIGNLGDITNRVAETLRMVDFILVEDTRVSIKLLNHLEIKKKLISLHEYSDERKLMKIIERIEASSAVALLSDAGTPLIADPGRKLIAALNKDRVTIIPIPGPSAVTTALSVSGFPADQYIFYGFIPVKKGKERILTEIADSCRTSVFFESPHRIIKTLQKLSEKTGPYREICVCREMTKMFEQYVHGTIEQMIYDLENSIKIKGEFTVVISPKNKKEC